MTYLLDTHTLIWAIVDPAKLSASVKELIEDPTEHIVLSTISLWEISLKYRLGKLKMEGITPDGILDICHQMDIEILPLNPLICSTYHRLNANHHHDPFDRMLIWLALSQKMTILSADRTMSLYESEGLQIIW